MIKRLKGYKDLLYIFVWRELIIRYKQTAIGVLWAVIQPLSMMVLFVLVFGVILKIDTGGVPKPLFYFAGLVPWTFFSSSVNASIESLVGHRDLITKIYFPREIIIFSRVSVFFIDFIVSGFLLLILLFFYHIPINITLFWILPLLFLLIMFTNSLCLLLSSFNVFYRDVKFASVFLLQIWFFASPVFYSIDKMDFKIKILLFINPLTYIIENFRRVLIEGRGVVMWQFAIEALFVTILFVASYNLFIKLERHFADVI